MRALLLCCLPGAALVSGCATDPDLIPAMQVSSAPYAAMTCAQLDSQMSATDEQLQALTLAQRALSRRDTTISWVALAGLALGMTLVEPTDPETMNGPEEDESTDAGALLGSAGLMALGYLVISGDQAERNAIARAKGELQAQRLEYERCRTN